MYSDSQIAYLSLSFPLSSSSLFSHLRNEDEKFYSVLFFLVKKTRCYWSSQTRNCDRAPHFMYIHTTTAKRTMKVIHTLTLALGLPHGEERMRGLRPAERGRRDFTKREIYTIREKNKKASFIFCVDVGRWRRQQQQQRSGQPASWCV